MDARRCLGLPAALVIFVAQAFFLAAMDPMTPLLAASLAGIANLVGDIALVCGLGWGIAGASLATAVAQVRQRSGVLSTCKHAITIARQERIGGDDACNGSPL